MKNSRKSSARKTEYPFFLIASELLILAISVLLGLMIGSVSLSPATVLRILIGQEQGTTAANILLLVRLPRVLGGLASGAALALAGAVIQNVLSNPLASPNVIGVNAGAGLAVAIAGALFPGMLALRPLFAFLGACAAVLIVLTLSERAGASRLTVVLAGMAISGIAAAGIDALITFVPDALQGYTDFRIGGLAGITGEKLLPAGIVITVCTIAVLFLCTELDLLMLGTETARTLGLAAKRVRLILLITASALAGAAISLCGLIGFIGLLVPHIIRRLTGDESAKLLPSCALLGASFLILCDLLSRTLFAPYELPTGITLSLIGGPYFLYLLLKKKRRTV